MINTEIFIPHSLHCDMGKTRATVMVRAGADMSDNVDSYIEEPCVGCELWSKDKVQETEAEIRNETFAQFGSDNDSLTGIRDGRMNKLEQLLVDLARFRGGEHKLVVGMCTPITKEIFSSVSGAKKDQQKHLAVKSGRLKRRSENQLLQLCPAQDLTNN